MKWSLQSSVPEELSFLHCCPASEACNAADGHFQVVPAYRADPLGNQAHDLLPCVRCRDEASIREASPCGDQRMAGRSRASVSGVQVALSAPCLDAQSCEPTIPSLFEAILIFGVLHRVTEILCIGLHAKGCLAILPQP